MYWHIKLSELSCVISQGSAMLSSFQGDYATNSKLCLETETVCNHPWITQMIPGIEMKDTRGRIQAR